MTDLHKADIELLKKERDEARTVARELAQMVRDCIGHRVIRTSHDEKYPWILEDGHE